jgi:DsbC/DsbD-like thiol-disulfide interchange protein
MSGRERPGGRELGEIAVNGPTLMLGQGGSRKVTQGLDGEATAAIKTAFEKSKQYAEATASVSLAKKESDMGIIQYIGQAKGSTSLRLAARNALAAKFVKYGKTAAEAGTVTQTTPQGAIGAAAKPDARMKALADYLFDFMRAS